MKLTSRVITVLALLQVTLFPGEVFSAKILFFHGVSSYSHRVQTWPLAEALAEQGHNVSYICPYYSKEPNPKIFELVPKALEEYNDKFLNGEFDVNIRIRRELRPLMESLFEFGYMDCEKLLFSPEFKSWLEQKENQKFDLVIIDNCFPECGMGLAHKLGAKYIAFSTVSVFAHEYDAVGFSPESSSVPELEHFSSATPFGFLERISNTLLSLRWRYSHYRYVQEIDKILREGLNHPNMPSSDNLIKNVNLVFSTGNVVNDYPRSLPPLYVDISGIHCKDSVDPLPQRIQSFINANNTGGPDDGFIYISLGSIVISPNLPANIQKVFFDVVKFFPKIKFLWKWNGAAPKTIPKNLMLEQWFPQIDILAHPKIRGFITQGGRPSTLEGLYNSVPMIAFPVLGDQDFNTQRMSETGAVVKLDLTNLKFEDLRDAVEKVVYDPSVKKRLTKLQSIFRDRPMTPLQTALWWTEYVLRNEDTAHLQPYGNSQYWFVRRQVDVWAFLTIVALSAIVCSVVVATKLANNFNENRKQKIA